MKTTVPRRRFLLVSVLAMALGTLFPALAQYTGPAGGGQSFDNRKPVLTLSFLICTNATFPNQGPGLGHVDLTHALLGQIIILPYNDVAPSGFAYCKGQSLQIISDTPLFAMLGNSFGGNGMTTFNLPDLRGVMPMGTGASASLGTIALGEQVGYSSTNWLVENLPPHVHSTPSGNTSSVGGGVAFSTMAPALGLGIDICTNGQLMIFAGNFIPAGWVACDGSLLNIAGQPVLYAAIGTTYGGNGTTTFALPDFRGHIPVATGSGAGLTTRVLGESFGASSASLSLLQMEQHFHSSGTGGSTGFAGGDDSVDITQPALSVNWFITPYTGTIPSASGSPPTLPLLGEIRLGAGQADSWGENWIQSAGQAEAIVQDEALYAFIGGTYGTNTSGYFFLPNVSSRSAVNFGQNAQGINYLLGQAVGSESVTMSYLSLPTHVHVLPGEINVLGPGGTTLKSGTVTNNFGSAGFGAPVSNIFTVANVGGLNLAVSNLVVGGANPGDFSVSPLSTNSIGPLPRPPLPRHSHPCPQVSEPQQFPSPTRMPQPIQW